MAAGGVISGIIDRVSFANYLPLLTKATADDNDATPGYMFEEILDISYQPSPVCQQLMDYLTRRLERPSPCVKLKVLKIILRLINNGHTSFRQSLRRNDGSIKIATMYSGTPDPLLGLSAYEMVRKTAQELLDLLFDPTLIQMDEDESQDAKVDRVKTHLAGLGSSGISQGKFDGFGSSPLDKKETIKEKVIDILDKYMNPPDETAKVIQAALTSSPGDYEPVQVCQPVIHGLPVPIKSAQIPTHVPGHAGGGWDSDDEDFLTDNLQSMSIGTTDSLDLFDSEIRPGSSLENQIITEFCYSNERNLTLTALQTACMRSATQSAVSVMRCIAEILCSESSSNRSKTRALLAVEWFLRKDTLLIPTIADRLEASIDNILREGSGADEAVRTKTRKIKLTMEKLLKGPAN